MAALSDIDTDLDALGAPPADLDALVAKYGTEDHGLERVDEALEALGHVVAPSSAPVVPVDNLAESVVGDHDLPAALSEPPPPMPPPAESEAPEMEVMIASEPPPAESEAPEMEVMTASEPPPAESEAPEMEVMIASEPPPAEHASVPDVASAPLPAPSPKLVAEFESLFEAEPAPDPSLAPDEAPPAESRESLDQLLEQEIDPSDFPRASESVAPEMEVVTEEEADSGLEMLVDDDDILEIDDVDLEEID